MNVRPLHDRILVQRLDDKQEKSEGGIIIPDSAKEKPQRGKVTAVGNGKTLDDGTKVALEIKKGDKVLFGKYAGTEVKIEGDEFLILREDDVLAVIGK
jgi:chaperonin GroES